MVDVKKVPADLLINDVASKLKSMNIEQPEWVSYLKDGMGKQKSWDQEDWYYTRLASMMRKLYLYGNLGIMHMSEEYGGKVDRGTKRYHPAAGSRYIVRQLFKKLEELGLVKKEKTGRVLSPQGRSMLDKSAAEVLKKLVEKNKELEKYL
ncbi:30S ribosomal protein S19e [Picrophilus oshimae]|uniref:Small ribosomal subunit protein eS19 n=1 Tax=Picrophilus torridus (strain ATCC 700027 / DSM 9790 / JCM 10055 / NBRC 100828 / KAW 2/3) TaxID=1122961 RepID=Q6L2L4_PICTO|nr:30S ribosomal protein S19e [Picrophilus oshimae]AAT42788.1 small subunit ribosomal protein S19E [Picrophilus oshimae DSM 9789]SMD31671.1 SSU ribosomal protein S19E [Picrophilus oshimae DSM 9789]